MNFYQQKYYQPYRKVNRELVTASSKPPEERPVLRERLLYDSPANIMGQARVPAFERSPSKYAINARLTTQPIWDYLYSEGQKSRKNLDEKHIHSKNRIDPECTFQPMIRQSKRYLIHSSSNFFERNNQWHEHKIQKKVKEKEDQVYSDLRECTFTPKINRKLQRPTENATKNNLRNDRSQRQLRDRDRNINPYYSPFREQKRAASPSPAVNKSRLNVEMPQALRLIKNQLRRLNI